MSTVKKALLAEYGGFSDKRIKNIAKGHLFIVDDRGPGDVGADGDLLPYFCLVFADVISDDEIMLTLHRNVPVGPAVTQWVKRYNASHKNSSTLELIVPRGRQHMVSELASAIRAIVAPGAPRYAVRSYKYVCPRTAASLERLKNVLDQAWGP
jgi:hypothetical protein